MVTLDFKSCTGLPHSDSDLCTARVRAAAGDAIIASPDLGQTAIPAIGTWTW